MHNLRELASKCLDTTETDLVEGNFYMWMIKIPSKFLDKHSISTDIELIAVEFHENKRKWLSLCVYKPPNQNDSAFVEAISAIANECSAQYLSL